ncbi:MAG: DUF3014 domain-containing protein [Vicinamibacterales bacterium]
MSDADDLQLDLANQTSTASVRPPQKSGGGPPIVRIAIAVLILLLLGAGGWWWYTQRQGQEPVRTAVGGTEAPVAAPAAQAPELPPMDQMDPFLRALLGALSSHPDLASWLASDDLIRQLAAAIDKASRGQSPSRDFKPFAPKTGFMVTKRGNRLAIDPAGYRRYKSLVDGVTAVDASAIAKAYRTVHLRLNEAYRNLGHPNGEVDVAVDAGLTILLDTPVLKDPTYVVEASGVRYKFADAKTEALYGSQKQLLRMGPDQTDKVLVWLRALQASLQGTLTAK